MSDLSFQSIILKLVNFWVSKGCIFLQPYDTEMGAGTLHPSTALRVLGKEPWNAVYLQPSRRPADGRFAENPNRVQHYYQLQVIIKPSPENFQEMYLESLQEIGIKVQNNDIRFVEDDWENPSIGASGLGYEVWLNGMEVTQFTYMQQMCGYLCRPVAGEITYGLERIAMHVQNVDSIFDIRWNDRTVEKKAMTYGDIFLQSEKEGCAFSQRYANIEFLRSSFDLYESECFKLALNHLPTAAYDLCLKASHSFNLLEARRSVSVIERANYLKRIRSMAKACAKAYLESKSERLEEAQENA